MDYGFGLEDRSVVFVTLDSCRYDVAASASLPNLSRLSGLYRAETPGTYTLPAHVAFFNGFLPTVLGGSLRVGQAEVDVIWRSAAARPVPARVAVPFVGQTLMEHYQRRGFRILGVGGVTFFDSRNPLNLLPGLFPEFCYFGRDMRQLAPGGRPRFGPVDRDHSLPLAHVQQLADYCNRHGKFFLFVNCACTHVPYTTPASPLTPLRTALLRRLYRLHELKASELRDEGLSCAEAAELLGMQRAALEWADQQLGVLFGLIRDRQPLVVVCADHGEEFGDGGRYGHAHAHESVTTVPLWCGLLA